MEEIRGLRALKLVMSLQFKGTVPELAKAAFHSLMLSSGSWRSMSVTADSQNKRIKEESVAERDEKHPNIKEGNFWPRSEQNVSGSRLQLNAPELAKHLWPKCMFHNPSQTANPKCSVIYQRKQIRVKSREGSDPHQARHSPAARIEFIHLLQMIHAHISSSFPLHMESHWETKVH